MCYKVHVSREQSRDVMPAVTWLKYCRYGVNLYPINQSINQYCTCNKWNHKLFWSLHVMLNPNLIIIICFDPLVIELVELCLLQFWLINWYLPVKPYKQYFSHLKTSILKNIYCAEKVAHRLYLITPYFKSVYISDGLFFLGKCTLTTAKVFAKIFITR